MKHVTFITENIVEERLIEVHSKAKLIMYKRNQVRGLMRGPADHH